MLSSHPILFRFIFFILAPIIFIFLACYIYLRQSLPQLDGTIDVQGLDSQILIERDKYGVPHINASTDKDAFFALGFVHAQDRLWQMEMQRRFGQGRLSEMLGKDMLAADEFARTIGFRKAAEAALAKLDEKTLTILEAYAAGVNNWLALGASLPIEYRFINVSPEPWTPVDSLIIVKLLALNLGKNYQSELMFDILVKELGYQRAIELIPQYSADKSYDSVTKSVSSGLFELSNSIKDNLSIGGKNIGSNSWVVSGKYTKTGLPILASDPHVGLQQPSFWYLASLKGQDVQVAGATVVGVPSVIIGRNKSIAWGITNLLADTQDLYVERLHPNKDNLYEVDGEWQELDVTEEEIKIAPQFPRFLSYPVKPVKWLVRSTRNGPLISDVIGKSETPISLRWTALDSSDTTIKSFIAMNYASNWSEFRDALSFHVAPALNFLYADTKNNIGHIAAGKIPLRLQHNGTLPSEGWKSNNLWEGYINFNDLPSMFNPDEGYIVNANNDMYQGNYRHFITFDWEPSYRASTIEEFIKTEISKNNLFDINDFVRLQGNVTSGQAKELINFFKKLNASNSRQKTAVAIVVKWDGEMLSESVAATIYQSWLKNFYKLIIEDELKGTLLHKDRVSALQAFISDVNPEFIHRIIKSDPDLWCDISTSAIVESCEDIGLIALDAALDELESFAGGNMDKWKWGDMLEARYRNNTFENFKVLKEIFSRSRRSSGDPYTVNVASWTFNTQDGFRQFSGASYRQVIDLDSWLNSKFILDTGQSGQVLSDHYDDLMSISSSINLIPISLNEKDFDKKTLTLKNYENKNIKNSNLDVGSM